MSGEWGALLNGVYLSGGDGSQIADILAGATCSELVAVTKGCLNSPPDGLGLPDLRTEDVTFPQRDGVRHFSDWYGPRIVTMSVSVSPGGCGCAGTARGNVRDILQAWKRSCDDEELVIYTDCHGSGETVFGEGVFGEDVVYGAEESRSLNGPFGLVGRPRAAQVVWSGGKSRSAQILLRFDANDQRLFVLDECGTPGSGGQCVTLTPDAVILCRTYDRCYDPTGMCYDGTAPGSGTGGEQTVNVLGTECARPTITLTGALNNPSVENVTTGEVIGYNGTIGSGDLPVIIDAYEGTATQGDVSRTHLLTGARRWTLSPGEVTLRLLAFSPEDDGTAEVCWRPAVVNA